MAKRSITFYASRDDLIDLILSDVKDGRHKYALGLDDERLPIVFDSVLDIPGFSEPKFGGQAHEAKYLLIPVDSVPVPRPFVMNDGRIKNFLHSVDQSSSVRLIPGGVYMPSKLVVAGEINVMKADTWSHDLLKTFRRAFAKRFRNINGVYVGVQAYEKFKQGYRLNASITAPLFTDLVEKAT